MIGSEVGWQVTERPTLKLVFAFWYLVLVAHLGFLRALALGAGVLSGCVCVRGLELGLAGRWINLYSYRYDVVGRNLNTYNRTLGYLINFPCPQCGCEETKVVVVL